MPQYLDFGNHHLSASITTLSLPQDAWSDTVNALVRVLLRKIPKNNLETFTYVTISFHTFPFYYSTMKSFCFRQLALAKKVPMKR